MKSAEDYLKEKGMANVGHYGLLITDPSKSKMHQIMEDYAQLCVAEALNKGEVEYEILVKTNSYAGNFEREMCAFMTGHIGECGVGEELVDQTVHDFFEDIVTEKPDDRGCRRPVQIATKPHYNDFNIWLEQKPSAEQFESLVERAQMYAENPPGAYPPKGLKFLGLELVKVTTNVTREIVTKYEV